MIILKKIDFWEKFEKITYRTILHKKGKVAKLHIEKKLKTNQKIQTGNHIPKSTKILSTTHNNHYFAL